MLTQTYNIDMIPSGVPLALHISQYDVGLTTFVFTPYVSVGTMDFSVVTEAYLEATKPDMRAIVHACTVGNGTITYTVQEQLAAVSGRVYSKLVLKDASGDVVASKAILWLVEPAGVADDAILSDSDLSGVSQVIQASTNFNDAVPTQTVSGEALTFDDAVEGAPLEDLVLHLVPKQNLNGYTHPWVGGAGKNLVNVSDATITSQTTVVSNQTFAAGTYTISVGTKNNGSIIGYVRVVVGGSPLVQISIPASSAKTRRSAQFTLESDSAVTIVCNGQSSGYNFEITDMMVESGSTATEFEPYENICPITGYDSVNLYKAGKNLWDASKVITGATINSSGNQTSSSATDLLVTDEVEAGKSYIYQYDYIEGKLSSSANRTIGFYDANGTLVGTETLVVTARSRVITIPSGTKTLKLPCDKKVFDIKLLKQENYTIIPISFASAGTVYGGTLDVTSGELTVTHVGMRLTSTNQSWSSGGTSGASTYRFYCTLNPAADMSAKEIMCSHATYLNGNTGDWGTYNMYQGIFTLKNANNSNPDIATLNDFKTWLDSQEFQICYPLATPITYQLTPTEVTTLLGYNTIWMDAEGTIDASYKVRLSSYFMALRTMLAPVEATYTATANYAVGDYLIVGTVLYKVTAAITSGETIAEGSNVTATTVMAEIKALQ